MSQITVRQAHAVLRDMGIFNIAESVVEEDGDGEAIRRWRRPSEVIEADDPIIQKLKARFGLPDSQIQTFFRIAAKKPGGPLAGASSISGASNMASTANEGTPKWLTLAKSYQGIREVAGSGPNKSNPKIDDFFKDAGYPGFYDDTSWCAAFVSAVMKRSGYPVLADLTARSGRFYGTKLSQPKIGCIVVFWRESPNSWKGHIGFVTGINHTTKTLKVLGGNQTNMVTEQTYPMSRVLSYRWPVAPTVKALKAAGSSEAKKSSLVKVGGGAIAIVGAAEQLATDAPSWVPEIPIPEVDAVQAIVERMSSWLSLLQNSSGLVLLVAGIGVWYLANKWQENRIERAKRGYPILAEDIEADGVTDA